MTDILKISEITYTLLAGIFMLFLIAAFIWAHVVYDAEIEKVNFDPIDCERNEDEV